MKKYILTFAAILFAAFVTTTVLTSCGDDDDDEFVTYYAVPKYGDNAFSQALCIEMNEAIVKAFGNTSAVFVTKRDDAKAIKACDEVANANRTSGLYGTIELRRGYTSSDPNSIKESETIKTYTFPF